MGARADCSSMRCLISVSRVSPKAMSWAGVTTGEGSVEARAAASGEVFIYGVGFTIYDLEEWLAAGWRGCGAV